MVWKWFNFSWTDSIKKRACRALLNRYLGKYLDQKLELDGMTIDLANGSCKVENVRLSADALNATLEEVRAPVHVESGVMSHISVSIPWMALMRENCSVEIEGITLEVGFRVQKDTPNIIGMSLTDSLLVSTGQTSIDIASEVTKEDKVDLEENYGGVDALAKAIQHILDRLKVSITNIKLVLRQSSSDGRREFAVRINIDKVEFFDSIREEPNSTSTTGNEKEQDVFMIRPFATKILRLVHPSLEFSDSPCPPLSADLATSMFKSGEHARLLNPPQRNCANWSLFAMATGQVEVKLKVKQQDEVPGKKIDLEGYCGAMHMLLSPEQLHSLTEMASLVASKAFTLDTPHTVSHEFGKSRPIRSQEYTHLESQLERQMMDHHLKLRMEREQRAQDPFYHPLEDEDPLNQSLSDLTAEDTFYSIELSTSSVYDGDLPPLGNPPKLSLRSDQFHSIKSTSSASPSNYSHVGTESITSTKSIRTVVSKSTDYNQDDDPSIYRFTLSALTMSVLHSDHIGIIHQDLAQDLPPESLESFDSARSKEEPMSSTNSRQNSVEGDEALRSRYLQSLAKVYSSPSRTTIEDLGAAVPTDHLLVWLSTVKWEAAQDGPNVDIETTFAKALLLENLFGDAHSSLRSVSSPLCCNQLLKLTGTSEPVASHIVPKPCFKMTHSSRHNTPKKQGGKSHSKSKMSKVKLDIEISSAELELDVTLVDRLDSLITAAKFNQPSSLQATKNYTSLYLNRDASHQLIKQKREEVFKQNLEDSSPSPMQWGVTCHTLKLLIKFPVPNAEQRSISNPWLQFQKMHDEKLIFNVCNVTMETTLDPTSNEELYNLKFDQLIGSLVHEGSPNGEQFLCVGGAEGEEQSIPEVTVKRCFQTTGDLDTPSASGNKTVLRSLGDSILEGMEAGSTPVGSTPFSTQRTTHIPGEEHSESEELFGEKVLPGNDVELDEFRSSVSRKSLLHVVCKLPYIMMNFSNKGFFDLLYNRLINDLLSWEPQRYSLDSSSLNGISLYNPVAPPPIEEVFQPCYSLQEEENEVQSSDVYDKASHGGSHKEDLDGIKNCQYSLHLIFDEAVVTIATSSVPTNEVQVEECETLPPLVEVSSPRDLHLPKVSCSPLDLRLEGLDLFVCTYQKSSIQHLAVQIKELTLSDMDGRVYLRPSIVGYQLSEVKYKSFFTVAMETRPSPPLFKTTKWSIMLSQGTMEHHVANSNWLTQLVDFISPPSSSRNSISISKQQMEVNLLHVHLRDSCIEYKPLHLPLTAVLWMEDVSLSTSVVPGSTEFSMRLLLDNCCMFLGHSDESMYRLSDCICVMEAGPLDLVLKTKKPDVTKQDDCGSLAVELSGGSVTFRTCADSCVALRDLVVYLASNGDLITSCPETAEDSPTTANHGVATTQPISSNQNQSDVSDYLLEAIEDEDSHLDSHHRKEREKKPSSGITKSTDKGTCVLFDSDSESDHNGSLPSGSVKISRPESVSMSSSSFSTRSSQLLSPPPSAPFPDEMEDEGFLVYEPASKVRSSRGAGDEPTVRYLCAPDHPLDLKDDYFAKPSGYADRLQRPRHFPSPVTSYTLKEVDVLWVWYGGNDFANYLNKHPSRVKKTKAAEDVVGSGKRKVGSGSTSKKGTRGEKGGRGFKGHDHGGVDRDHTTQVELSLSKVRAQYEVYPSAAKECSRIALVIHDVEIRDRLSISEINKLLYQNAREGLPKQTHANMLSLKVVFVQPDPGDPLEEGSVRISVLPVRVNLDQDTMYFLQDFFLNISLAEVPSCLHSTQATTPPAQPTGQSQENKGTNLYIKTFTFSPDVPVRIDYVAKHIDIDKGNIAGILGGLSHLNCLQLSIKSIHTSRGFTSWNELSEFVIGQWQADITRSQLPGMISGVGPLHYITQFVNGFVDLLWLPWQQYQEDGRILRGLQRGASSFTASTGSASLELTSRLVSAFESFVRMVNNVTGDTSNEAPPPLHPQGMYEGLTTAYNVVSEGVTGTVSEAVQTVYNEHEDRGLVAALGGVVRFFPRVVLRPIIHVSEATRLALTGMKNELIPEARREESEKYRMDKK